MRTKRYVLLALFCALAAVLGYFEQLVPAFTVIPGGKIGLANVVTMVVFGLFGVKTALLFGVLRCLVSALLYSGVSAFVYSLAGTVLSVFAMFLSDKLLKQRASLTGISVIGAVFFNIGQLVVASFVLETTVVFRYFPVLGVLSALSGVLTGYLGKQILHILTKHKNGEGEQWK